MGPDLRKKGEVCGYAGVAAPGPDQRRSADHQRAPPRKRVVQRVEASGPVVGVLRGAVVRPQACAGVHRGHRRACDSEAALPAEPQRIVPACRRHRSRRSSCVNARSSVGAVTCASGCARFVPAMLLLIVSSLGASWRADGRRLDAAGGGCSPAEIRGRVLRELEESGASSESHGDAALGGVTGSQVAVVISTTQTTFKSVTCQALERQVTSRVVKTPGPSDSGAGDQPALTAPS